MRRSTEEGDERCRVGDGGKLRDFHDKRVFMEMKDRDARHCAKEAKGTNGDLVGRKIEFSEVLQKSKRLIDFVDLVVGGVETAQLSKALDLIVDRNEVVVGHIQTVEVQGKQRKELGDDRQFVLREIKHSQGL